MTATTASRASLRAAAVKRDGQCVVCGMAARPVLAAHHVIPVSLGGSDSLRNLVTLCSNCHRSVHWLASGDRCLEAHAYGLGSSGAERKRLRARAGRIRSRRLSEFRGSTTMASAIPLHTAFDAVIRRNGLDQAEARLMMGCFRKAWRAMDKRDQRQCSVHLPRGARHLSVNANNHLALRVPAWGDDKVRLDYDMLLIWPQAEPPSTVNPRAFRLAARSRFRLIPYFTLALTWQECLSFTARDWQVYRDAVHAGLWMARTRKRRSNVIV